MYITIRKIIKRSEGRRRKTHQCDYSNMPNWPALSSVEKALAWLHSPFLRGVVELVLVHIRKALTTNKQTNKQRRKTNNCPALSSVEKALAWLDSPFLRGVVELVLVHIGKALTTNKQINK